jgi:hypothetical protein
MGEKGGSEPETVVFTGRQLSKHSTGSGAMRLMIGASNMLPEPVRPCSVDMLDGGGNVWREAFTSMGVSYMSIAEASARTSAVKHCPGILENTGEPTYGYVSSICACLDAFAKAYMCSQNREEGRWLGNRS